ncbi:YchJ family protein [Micromonospora cathayae]|uniref:UPF0225 protein PVK37_19635 n=1 Tax=Micromonospora cathayae TaxID=3028804 RepID=A0ABY7ZIG9_9ACTN|nr:YchJ family protein [Micromonospora sp. HUAS 3]WDZ82680.1 YchJ family protein [Micromonospora sp. HUAS 3]
MAKRGATRRTTDELACPCGSGQRYAPCCGRLHRGEADAGTAESLMRARFAAFAVRDTAYLLRSWDATTRPVALDLEPGTRWTRLEVLSTSGGGLFDATGTVEFRAHYRERGRVGTLHERSRFRRTDGRWFYLDGRTDPA